MAGAAPSSSCPLWLGVGWSIRWLLQRGGRRGFSRSVPCERELKKTLRQTALSKGHTSKYSLGSETETETTTTRKREGWMMSDGCDVRGWAFFLLLLRPPIDRSTRLHLAAACLASRRPSVRIPSDCLAPRVVTFSSQAPPLTTAQQPTTVTAPLGYLPATHNTHTHSLCGCWHCSLPDPAPSTEPTTKPTHPLPTQARVDPLAERPASTTGRRRGGPRSSSSGRRDATPIHQQPWYVRQSIDRSMTTGGGGAVMVTYKALLFGVGPVVRPWHDHSTASHRPAATV